MVEAFQDWIRDNGSRLKELGFAITVHGPLKDHPEAGMWVELVAGRIEASIQTYEYEDGHGECDITLIDWDLASAQPDTDPIEVSYFVFQSPEDMRDVLGRLVDRMVSKPDPGS